MRNLLGKDKQNTKTISVRLGSVNKKKNEIKHKVGDKIGKTLEFNYNISKKINKK